MKHSPCNPFSVTRRQVLHVASAALPAVVGLPSFAQGSSAPVKLIVGYPPGGLTDSIARVLAERLTDELKRPVLVDNRPGAGARVAAAAFRRLPAEGDHLMLNTDSLIVQAPLVFRSLPFDVFADFAPVSMVAQFSYAFATGSTPKVETLAQYVDWLRKNPDKANFGHPAPGSAPHFYGLMFGEKVGVPMTAVPYQGGAPMLAALAGGQVSAAINAVAVDMVEMHRSGRTRIVAVSGDKRVPQLSEVPTVVELGYPSVPRGWAALYLPAGAPPAVVGRMNSAIVAVLANKDVQARLAGFGLDPGSSSAESLAATMRADFAVWRPIIAASGFKLDS